MPTIAIRILGGKEKIKGKVNTCEGNIVKIFRLKMISLGKIVIVFQKTPLPINVNLMMPSIQIF